MVGPGFAAAVGGKMVIPMLLIVAAVFGVGMLIGWLIF
jgi:hypothetical protein